MAARRAYTPLPPFTHYKSRVSPSLAAHSPSFPSLPNLSCLHHQKTSPPRSRRNDSPATERRPTASAFAFCTSGRRDFSMGPTTRQRRTCACRSWCVSAGDVLVPPPPSGAKPQAEIVQIRGPCRRTCGSSRGMPMDDILSAPPQRATGVHQRRSVFEGVPQLRRPPRMVGCTFNTPASSTSTEATSLSSSKRRHLSRAGVAAGCRGTWRQRHPPHSAPALVVR